MANSSRRHNHFMEIAFVVSKMSTCERQNVGAVIVRDGMILGTGYNGNARGEKHCEEGGCNIVDGHCQAIHSEENAIINCAYNGVSTKGATIYCTHRPCDRCLRRIVNAGIEQVIFFFDYRMDDIKFISDRIIINKISDFQAQ